jgi:hypothetical protein
MSDWFLPLLSGYTVLVNEVVANAAKDVDIVSFPNRQCRSIPSTVKRIRARLIKVRTDIESLMYPT